MNKELLEALEQVEKEKNISKETLLEAIENSLLTACKNHFGKADNVKVNINPSTGDFSVYAEKEVVEQLDPEEGDPMLQISLAEAKMMDPKYDLGDIVHVPIKSKEFGRIATQNAKNVILQKIREEERKVLYKEYYSMEKEVMTGTVTRFLGRNISINLGRVDAILNESEQVKGEVLNPTDRVKVYILEVKDTPKGPRISVSRTHPDLVKRLFEEEVAEVKDGTVEIKAIAREAGSRTKIAVASNDANVDPVGACVGLNGARVGSIVNELGGEKIDIINWDENPAYLIENALSPAKVICVVADEEEKEAQVIVPDYQLSLAIGKEGQNARLAARLTGYKIDIKSETQAREMGLFDELGLDDREEGGYEEYQDMDSYDEDAYGEDSYEEDPDGAYDSYRDEDDYQDQ
ncbi:transcription termination/antitermination protein NusA [Lachnoclostridium sp. An14]|uniref:transcription termination factor NusA n=1 Tax=Lachnoclostridium sp. An14 TaxID=1965562 RepID=UPI000B3B093B|nr:transcription termination factor NusA [Lachnoclostridium sp. An14]OUQ21510.1 transcription termination/antitermination protein NusA [Lachnoclostridium sp. An14]